MKRRNRGADAKGRSKGEAKHVRLYRYMLKSPAYRSLSCYARALLVEFGDLHNGDNNGDLFMGVRTAAAALNVAKDTAAKALHELEDHGFIRARQRGAFSLKQRHATTWVLTEHAFAGQLPTKDFMTWRAPPENQNTVLRSGTNGTTSWDRCAQKHPENTPDGTTSWDREGQIPTPTVLRRGTQIVNQGGWPTDTQQSVESILATIRTQVETASSTTTTTPTKHPLVAPVIPARRRAIRKHALPAPPSSRGEA